MKPLFISGLFFLFTVSMTAFKSQQTPRQTVNYQKLGDSLSLQAQQSLISNLLGAIEKGGAAYAVEFCNEKAASLTNALSQKHQVEIKRVSAKNRNPDNAASLFDKKILDLFEAKTLKDTVVKMPKGYVYYKPIRIGMPTCLQCHGKPMIDINEATASTIRKKYRFDKATGYAMGELRGAWKLTFESKQ